MDNTDDELGHQRGAVGAIQAVQGTTEAIVVELRHRQRCLTDGARVNGGDPRGQLIQRVFATGEVVDEQQQ